jgi:hypothetical protein
VKLAEAVAQKQLKTGRMTTEQLRAAHRSTPFRPFTIRMADGRTFAIAHPDFLSISPAGRTVVIYHPDDSASIVDLLLMTELELSPPSSAGV